MLFDHFIVIDWSARSAPSPAKPHKDAIWLAEGKADAARTMTKYFRTRKSCQTYLVKRLHLLRQQDKPTATNTKNNDQSSSNHSTKSEYSDDIKAISSNTQTIGSERPHGSNRNSNNTARQHSGQPANTLSLAAVATVVQPPVAAATVGVIDGGIVQVEAATAQIAALNPTEHDCEQQVVGVPSDRSPEAWSSARNASFYYCTINWKVSRASHLAVTVAVIGVVAAAVVVVGVDFVAVGCSIDVCFDTW